MASPTQAPSQAPPRVKGSWEDLLDQATQLDQNRNADAIPIYMKLVNRLRAMPESKRLAHGERLQRILEEAAIRVNEMFNSLERYDESLEMMDLLDEILDDEDKGGNSIFIAKINVLTVAERHDEALALLTSMPEQPDEAPLFRLVREFSINLDAGRLEQATDALNRYLDKVDSKMYQATVTDSERNQAQADWHSMKSILLIHQKEWDAAIAHYVDAVALNDDLDEGNYHMLYSNLVHHGQPERAIPFIEQEPMKVRRNFWHGLALYHMGQKDEATSLWEQGQEEEITQEEADAYIELVLRHYYLGDKVRMGLELFLRMLQETENPSWQIFFFVALGWGVHNNMTNALHNMDFAVDRARRNFQSRTIPWTMWLYVEDLIAPENQAQFLPFFDEAEIARHRA